MDVCKGLTAIDNDQPNGFQDALLEAVIGDGQRCFQWCITGKV
jgi:hypothetical protein